MWPIVGFFVEKKNIYIYQSLNHKQDVTQNQFV